MPKIAYNVETDRPGCANLQAVYGGSPGIAGLFPTERWQLEPTGLRLYELDERQLAVLVRRNERLAQQECVA